MSNALQVISRGVDSSGRPVRGTRQNFQFYDRLNKGPARGLLVIVQGSFSFAEASAGTHSKAMCMDYRTWNLTEAIRNATVREGRNLMGTMWYRSPADGFDPHIHNNLIGDSPAAPLALSQVSSYKAGRNGLANNMRDRNPYRPERIHNYVYLEDDMFEAQDRNKLDRIITMLEGERTRDQKKAQADKERFRRTVALLGQTADQLTVLINDASDDATKMQLKKTQEKILLELKNDPDVTEEDNPSDDGLAERNMG